MKPRKPTEPVYEEIDPVSSPEVRQMRELLRCVFSDQQLRELVVRSDETGENTEHKPLG